MINLRPATPASSDGQMPALLFAHPEGDRKPIEEDLRAALIFLKSRSDVDRDRIQQIGKEYNLKLYPDADRGFISQ